MGVPHFTTGCIRPEEKYKQELNGCASYEEAMKQSDLLWEEYYSYQEGAIPEPIVVEPFEGWVYRSEKIRNGKLVIELAKWVRP